MTTRIIASQIARHIRYRFNLGVMRRTPIWPLMKPREVEVILDLLSHLHPRRVLEWGAGYGTVYFTRQYREFDYWISMEHTCEWAERIGQLNRDPRVRIIQTTKDPEFEEYANYPARFGPFDFILVDGRARVSCLTKAVDYLSDRGCLVLHDAGRTHYHPLPSGFRDTHFFEDYRTDGGLWVASLRWPISDLIDLPRHLSVWRFYQRAGRQINWLYGPGIFPKWRDVL